MVNVPVDSGTRGRETGRVSQDMQCTMFAYSTSPHVSQLYTGFSLLSAERKIRLTQKLSTLFSAEIETMKNLRPSDLNGLFVLLDGRKTIYYDTSDSAHVRMDALEICDVYFKRSYASALIPKEYHSKVHPLGLNYEIYVGKANFQEISRFLLRKAALDNFPKELVKRCAELASLSFLPTVSHMCAPPILTQEPRVLFMARAWDPEGESAALTAREKAERAVINTTRARCIQLLRKELGSRFYGGFAQTKYAVQAYKGLILENPISAGKKNYLSLLQDYPICISTTGLHGSIGWKLAEYVAFSKAIVSEKLRRTVPCDFEPNQNYLEFDTAEECVQQTIKLIEDKVSRQSMMENNWQYYNNFLAPDKLVWRTLEIAAQAEMSQTSQSAREASLADCSSDCKVEVGR